MNIQSKKMGKNVTLGYLGYKFQSELINQILHPANKKFSDRIIDIVHAKYFDNEYFRLIVAQIKDYYEKYEKIPAMDTLETILKMEIKDKVTQDYVFEMLKEIRDLAVEDWEFVQSKALNFCRQQELKKANEKINKIVDNGEFDNYETCAEILREALSVGAEKDDGTSITENIEAVLEKNFRHPIPTGINGIDNLTDGGLSRGELGVILAPYGVGKTTILTKIANSAYNQGYNVLPTP
jgi:replicative DNA helicase